ncbi:MAG: MBL fold metallo-hydrolase [Candidatus Rokubacteria bacterium]|nr:MBL fold metallo-hydrolase [Candidatus Rokubacteria bacterium]
MRVVLLGTGCPPPSPTRRGPASLVALGTERLLVDCGSGVAAQLVQAGLRAIDLHRILITHLHSDHVIDLGHLLISRWILGQNAPLEVWGPSGTKRHVGKVLDLLDWDIEVRREHMRGRGRPEFGVTEVEEGEILAAGDLRVKAFLVEHPPVEPAFGFRFDGGGRSVVISGDTRPCENLIRQSQGADVLIHECTDATKTSWAPGCGWPTRDAKVAALASYHTQPDEVGKVAARARVKTLVLSHLMPGSEAAELADAAARDFAGSVVVGADLMEV